MSKKTKQKEHQKYQSNQALATKRLVKKALKDKFKIKPSKGYKYLKDLKIGSLFEIDDGMKGILINYTVNCKVIITDAPNINKKQRESYLGNQTIASTTEVKEIK